MKLFLVKENLDAEQLIPPNAPDNSGIGINYVDAYLKPLNTILENGTKIVCRRAGLKINVTIGDQLGDAIIRRVDHGPDVRDMLREALHTAARKAGAELVVEDNSMYLIL
jgi:hypothetical protein